MKKWELKSLVDELEGKIISLQMDNGQLRTRVRNLKERVNRHNERVIQLEEELISLRNDRECIQESLDEFGSDTVYVIEMCLKDRLTEEEMGMYRRGMEMINDNGGMTKMGEPPDLNIDLRVQVDNLVWVLHWAHKDNEMLGEKIEKLEISNVILHEKNARLEKELRGLRMVELDLSMTEEEYKVYEEGMKVLNCDGRGI